MERINNHLVQNEPEQGEGTDFQIPFDPSEPGSVEIAAEQLKKRFGLGYTPTLYYHDRMARRDGFLARRIESLWRVTLGGLK